MADFFCPPGFLSGAHVGRQFPDFFVLNQRNWVSLFSLKKILFVSEFSARLPDDIWRLVVYTGFLILDLVSVSRAIF